MNARVPLALVDYGAGNLASVQKALEHVGFDVTRAMSGVGLGARPIVIPGVGHFSSVTRLLDRFAPAIERAIAQRIPVLGICLGLQVLFDGSDEAPGVPGLGFFSGRCFRIAGGVKVPHVGWNSLDVSRSSRLLAGVDGQQVYFTHSFAAPVTEHTVGITDHGGRFSSAVERDLVFGVQWHPEKSGEAGLTVLRNFHGICGSC